MAKSSKKSVRIELTRRAAGHLFDALCKAIEPVVLREGKHPPMHKFCLSVSASVASSISKAFAPPKSARKPQHRRRGKKK